MPSELFEFKATGVKDVLKSYRQLSTEVKALGANTEDSFGSFDSLLDAGTRSAQRLAYTSRALSQINGFRHKSISLGKREIKQIRGLEAVQFARSEGIKLEAVKQSDDEDAINSVLLESDIALRSLKEKLALVRRLPKFKSSPLDQIFLIDPDKTHAAESNRDIEDAIFQLSSAILSIEERRDQLLKQRKIARSSFSKNSVDDTRKFLDLGAITSQEALSNLEEVKLNDRSSLAQKYKASQEIIRIRKDAIAAEIEAIQAGQADIESRLATGSLSEVAADRQLTELKIQEIERRIDATRVVQENGTGSTKQKAIAEERQLQANLEKVKAEANKRAFAQKLAAFDQQRAILEAKFAQGKISQPQYNQELLNLNLVQNDVELKQLQNQLAKLSTADIQGREGINGKIAEVIKKRSDIQKAAYDREVEVVLKANAKVEDAIKQSQDSRIALLREVELKAVQAPGADREQIERQTQQQIAQIQRSGISQELEAKKQALAKIKAVEAPNREAQEAAYERQRQLINEISQLNLQRLDAEKQQLEQIRQTRIQVLDQELARTREVKELRSSALSLENSLLGQQSNLIQSRLELVNSLASLDEQRLQFALENAKAAKDETGVRQLQQSLYDLQITSLNRQSQAKLDLLALTEKQKNNELQIAQITAEIATLEAQANLEKAIADGRSVREIENLRKVVELKQQALQLTQSAIAEQQAINANTRNQIGVEARTAREKLRREQLKEGGIIGNDLGNRVYTGSPGQPRLSTQGSSNSDRLLVGDIKPGVQQFNQAVQQFSQATAKQDDIANAASQDAPTIVVKPTEDKADPAEKGTVRRSLNLSGEDITRYDRAGSRFDQIIQANKDGQAQQLALLQELMSGLLSETEKDFFAVKLEAAGFGNLITLAKQLEQVDPFQLSAVFLQTAIQGQDTLEAFKKLADGAKGAADSLGGIPKLQARRLGGSVQPGQPYLVGEAGPEIIMPNRSGYVMTAPETANLLSGFTPQDIAPVHRLAADRTDGTDKLLMEVRNLNGRIDRLVARAAYPRTLVVQNPQTNSISAPAQIWSEIAKRNVQMAGY